MQMMYSESKLPTQIQQKVPSTTKDTRVLQNSLQMLSVLRKSQSHFAHQSMLTATTGRLFSMMEKTTASQRNTKCGSLTASAAATASAADLSTLCSAANQHRKL